MHFENGGTHIKGKKQREKEKGEERERKREKERERERKRERVELFASGNRSYEASPKFV